MDIVSPVNIVKIKVGEKIRFFSIRQLVDSGIVRV